MGRSESSDSDYDRRRRKKKKERHRSRSRSLSSSDRGSSRKRSRKSSRDRKRSRSRSRSRGRSRRKHRSRSRSRSRSRENRSRRRRDRSRSDSRERKSNRKTLDDDRTLKDKINALTMKSDVSQPEQPVYKPSEEEIARIEKDSFVQEHFSKTYNQPNAPQQRGKKKKKKKKQQQLLQQNTNNTNELTESNVTAPKGVSHDDAIFGTASDSLHLSKFSSRIDTKRREDLNSKEETNENLIFGAIFCEEPAVRMKRWLGKLQSIRKQIRESEGKT